MAAAACAAAAWLAVPAFGQAPVYTRENAPAAPALTAMPRQASVSRHGVTWTFERPTPVGRFMNGDAYVVGPVTITAIDPAPQYDDEVAHPVADEGRLQRRARNGAVLNTPAISNRQGFDSRESSRYEPAQSARLPIAMQPGDSLISAISAERPHGVSGGTSPVSGYAILTCVAAPLPPDAFRPSYADHRGSTGEPTIYLARNLDRDRLPRLAPPEGTPNAQPFIDMFERTWVDIVFFGRMAAPNQGGLYGRQVARRGGHAALLLTLDLPDAQREPLLIHFVQYGIDLYGLARAGHNGWPAHGGWGSGRKLPIVLAGALLGDERMARVTENYPNVMFQENEQTAHDRAFTGAGVVYTGHVGHRRAFGGRERTPLGWGPYEHLHPTRWTNWIGTSYRSNMTSNTWMGTALVVRILQLEDVWGDDSFLDYCDRWMHEPDPGYGTGLSISLQGATHSDSRFFKVMWDAFRESLPPIAGRAPPRPPTGWQREPELRGPAVEAGAGLRVGGRPLFPVMIWAEHPGRIADARAIGANILVEGCFETPQNFAAFYQANIRNDAFLNALAEHGLYGVFGADARTVGHPALLGWTHVDQPDVVAAREMALEGRARRDFSPATTVLRAARGSGTLPPELEGAPDHLLLVEPAYRWMRAMDASRPVFLTLGSAFLEAAEAGRREICEDYLRHGDVYGLRPGAAATPEVIAQALALLGRLRPGRPRFVWIETRVEGEAPEAAVTRVRAQVGAALAAGAAGIGYRGFEGLDPAVKPAPEVMAELARLNAELTEGR